MKKHFILLLSSIFFMLFTACTSNQIVEQERSETFIADINSFEVGKFHLYTTLGLGRAKITDFYVSFAPRTNYILLKARIGIDAVEVGFSYPERQSLNMARETYILAYESDSIPNVKANKKNAISKGQATVAWGSLGLTHKVTTTYFTNYYYLEPKKPYFRIKFDQAEEKEGDKVNSPALSIYISPSQWEKILEACNQEHLVELTDEILSEAEEF